MKKSIQQKGFSLVELMVVIAIMAILAALIYPNYTSYIQRARLDNARTVITSVSQFMERHYAQNNTFCAPKAATTSTSTGTGSTEQACTGPTITFFERSANASKATNVILLDNDFYTFELTSVFPSRYVVQATPKAGLYSNNTLSTKKLILQYDSSASSIARCNLSGIASSNANKDPGTNCEVM
ncbi:type IV pilin protein [Kingella negevensis]|uniref:type IV pilin protein n=1 Tax=Kingella negevensis TaxID=1522312 RepID=UPI002543C2C1|nr:type IV pilin protein [Kingella negevensis]WII92882.1 type IV pilin protein [Kingella negevensis]